jgi:hypothetical protein
MQQVRERDVPMLSVEDEVFAAGIELAAPHWRELITEILRKEDVHALYARFNVRRRGYSVELVGHQGYQKLRSYQLIAADIASVDYKDDDHKFANKVGSYISNRESIVFVDVGEYLRIYHFRAV